VRALRQPRRVETSDVACSVDQKPHGDTIPRSVSCTGMGPRSDSAVPIACQPRLSTIARAPSVEM
jgi:hypothetical protein